MKTWLGRIVLGAFLGGLGFGLGLATVTATSVAKATSTMQDKPVAHSVFFELKDTSEEAVAKFVASCHKYLSGHEGTVSFEVGARAEDIEEPVSVKNWQVALLIVFENKEAGAKYLKAPRHTEFVNECRSSFASVRVFDSYLTPKP